ncbi:AraC family transcriptional regulator [Pedobacter gandavensis]|uniref:helix-turn-helix domain-containing protein n=1 Tax=Pedobacter gandavensis TaxID=2679963 RepID=UPI00292F5F07|nr:AraC family transcriptional regulator [Pedobacter gandavensis]
MKDVLLHKLTKPDRSISDFVYCFSSIQNLNDISDGVIIPNGRIDLTFYKTSDNQFQISLLGLETKPKLTPKQDISTFFSINFNPLAVEYLLHESVADILDSGKIMPIDFWDFNADDLNDFDSFCEKGIRKIQSLLPKKIDGRKRRLFELIFESNGEISVKELSEKIFWKARQINEYFNQRFGISLKTYCSILRFQASLSHIKEGKLFPQLNYYDQSHFIKEIKKLAGASPKELFKNENHRFLQFLVNDKE